MTDHVPPRGLLPARIARTFGPGSIDRSADRTLPGVDGAEAALATFYCALNGADLALLTSTWGAYALVQLDNPVGGILRGREAVTGLYRTLFDGPLRLQVELRDVVSYPSPGLVVFTGREVGSYRDPGRRAVPLSIRTTRVVAWIAGTGWAQVHHHGSIDDADALRDYQEAVRR